MPFLTVKLRLFCLDDDFEFAVSQQKDLFEAGVNLSTGGGLLIRPDQHILGRVREETTAQDIVALIGGHLGLP